MHKWRQRSYVTDRTTGPSHPRSTILSLDQEAVIVEFRRHRLLPLDDCLYALQAMIPSCAAPHCTATWSATGISRLSEVEGNKPAKEKFHSYPIGFSISIWPSCTVTEGKLYLFVATDRTSRLAFVQLGGTGRHGRRFQVPRSTRRHRAALDSHCAYT